MSIGFDGLGVVGGFGAGNDALWQALQAGQATPVPVELAAEGGSFTLPVYRAATDRLEEFVPKRALRRIDHLSRMTLLAAHLALQDAGTPTLDPQRTGTIVASGYGATGTTFAFLDSVLADGDSCASPTHFSSSVHNAAAANLSIQLGLQGPCLTVSQFEQSVFSALAEAQIWLRESRVDRVLLACVDEFCPVLGYCWQRYFGPPPERPQPLALDRQTALPGEGAVAFLLSREGGQPGYGRLAQVQYGRGVLPPFSADMAVLGADGHRRCSARYGAEVPADIPATALAALTGSLPVGSAFDLAAAALARRQGQWPKPAEAAGGSWPQLAAGTDLTAASVACVKCGADDDYGLLTLVAAEGGRSV